MRHKLLGKSGLRVSELCLGTMAGNHSHRLEGEHLRRLDEVSRIELGFPHEFLQRDTVKGFVYGIRR